MKVSSGVIENDWRNKGSRRRAQGARKLKGENKNRGKGLKVESLFDKYKKEGKQKERPMGA
jgi:hypothetical protein